MTMLVSELRPDSCVVAEVRSSPNHSERRGNVLPDMIVLHYTGTRDNEAAICHLCSPASDVSAHYVVLQEGHIVQLVLESRRAWHAGVSTWSGENDINSHSIGIEIANPGHDNGYPDFPRRQIAAVTALCRSPTSLRHERWIQARNFPGSFWPSPGSASGSILLRFLPPDQYTCWAKPIRQSRRSSACSRVTATMLPPRGISTARPAMRLPPSSAISAPPAWMVWWT